MLQDSLEKFLKKKSRDQVDFWFVDKQESAMTYGGRSQACQK